MLQGKKADLTALEMLALRYSCPAPPRYLFTLRNISSEVSKEQTPLAPNKRPELHTEADSHHGTILTLDVQYCKMEGTGNM